MIDIETICNAEFLTLLISWNQQCFCSIHEINSVAPFIIKVGIELYCWFHEYVFQLNIPIQKTLFDDLKFEKKIYIPILKLLLNFDKNLKCKIYGSTFWYYYNIIIATFI